jgi:hypothetical protein
MFSQVKMDQVACSQDIEMPGSKENSLRTHGTLFNSKPCLVQANTDSPTIWAVPWFAQKVVRRWSIFIGSAFQCIGALLQGFAQNCMLLNTS